MKKNDYSVSVGLYLRGDSLDPEYISKNMNTNPTTSQYKGEKKITKTNHEYVTQIGVWELVADSDSQELSHHVNQLTAKIGKDQIAFRDITGVQEAYVDVFISTNADEEGEGTVEFELSEENLSALERWKVPIRFTVAVIKE